MGRRRPHTTQPSRAPGRERVSGVTAGTPDPGGRAQPRPAAPRDPAHSDSTRRRQVAPDATPLVRIRGLRFSRGDRPVFDGVDLDIHRGQVTAIMGPSGTGKTTLLKLISGQLRPDAGTVEVDGQDVHRLSRGDLYRLRTRMGMLFQSGALLTDLSVFENVAYPLREHTRLPESMIRKLVLMKLEAVGLRGARDLVPSELSGGMARRVALARAVALDPLMILYDEPFTGQDPISMGVLVTLIRQLNDASGLSSIVVSHDVRETAAIADHLYLIANGKIMAQGTPEEIEATTSQWVRQFMHGEPDGPVHFHYPAPPLNQDFLGRGAATPRDPR
jgi:phospholipid/cholesterol/gamma-HCH transport system ATP-binding protein